jgi:hypothetical protein
MKRGNISVGFHSSARLRAQSAMEFLMTYGWAILIIAVVLGSLFQLGVFNSASLTGISCTASPGYLCRSPTMVTTGLVSFTFGQSTAYPLYNFQLACAASADSSGTPNPLTAFNSISSNGAALPSSSVGNTLANGQSLVISSLPCYSSSGAQLGTQSIGSSFSGYIWVNYTNGAGAANSGSNPWRTVKAIVLKTKVQ